MLLSPSPPDPAPAVQLAAFRLPHVELSYLNRRECGACAERTGLTHFLA